MRSHSRSAARKRRFRTSIAGEAAELNSAGLTMPMAATVGGRDKSVPPESVRRLFRTFTDQGRPVR